MRSQCVYKTRVILVPEAVFDKKVFYQCILKNSLTQVPGESLHQLNIASHFHPRENQTVNNPLHPVVVKNSRLSPLEESGIYRVYC